MRTRPTCHVPALALALLALAGCQTWRRVAVPHPTFKLVNARLTRLSLSDATIECIVQIENDDIREWTARNFQAGIYVNEQLVGIGLTKELTQIPGKSTGQGSVTVTATFQDILRTVDVYRDREVKEVEFVLRGTLDLASALGMVKVDFEEKGTMPVPRLPKVELKRVKVKDIGWLRYLALIELDVSNPNVFEMSVEKVTYDFYLGEDLVASGKRPRRWVLPASGEAKLELPVEIKLSKALHAVRASVEAGQFDYRVKGLIVFTSLLGQTEFPIDKKGRVNVDRDDKDKKGKDKDEKEARKE